MRKIILSSISILIFSFCLFGQNKEVSPCPSGLSVTGPGGLVSPGDSITFTSSINNPENYPVKYQWTVKGGEIIKGRGTSAITVFQTGEMATASLEVIDLSGRCETLTASETTVICNCVYSRLVDEITSFGSNFDNDIKARLDNFAVTLKNDPNATAYIIGYFSKNKSESSIKTELNKITDYLIKVRKLDASRITVATSESDNDDVIRFWIVPVGASPPTP